MNLLSPATIGAKQMYKPLIKAHCGDSRNAPPNTLAAFESAINKGADAIHFDLHLTKDDEPIVYHDSYLDRTQSGNVYIGDYTLAELKMLDVGSWYRSEFANERMPTLNEVFELGRTAIRYEIDLKTPSLNLLNRVIHVTEQFGVEDEVELTSPHIPLLFHAKRIAPRLRTGLFFHPYPDWMKPALWQQHIIDWMCLTNAQNASMLSNMLDESFTDRLHKNGIEVTAALNDEFENRLQEHAQQDADPSLIKSQLRTVMNYGIDQLGTKWIELAVSVRNEIALTKSVTHLDK
jgi:glycerophosphoryl diester phosphodiesterase